VIVRLNDVRAADLLVAFGRQPGDDQIPVTVQVSGSSVRC
jgi:hypothetical protein